MKQFIKGLPHSKSPEAGGTWVVVPHPGLGALGPHILCAEGSWGLGSTKAALWRLGRNREGGFQQERPEAEGTDHTKSPRGDFPVSCGPSAHPLTLGSLDEQGRGSEEPKLLPLGPVSHPNQRTAVPLPLRSTGARTPLPHCGHRGKCTNEHPET